MANPETISGAPLIGRNEPPPPPASETAQVAQVGVNDSKITAHYANFYNLSGTPEELLMEFSLDSRTMDMTRHSVEGTQRIVMSWHTAKRLMQVLQRTVERYEAAFGVLETDVPKRARHT